MAPPISVELNWIDLTWIWTESNQIKWLYSNHNFRAVFVVDHIMLSSLESNRDHTNKRVSLHIYYTVSFKFDEGWKMCDEGMHVMVDGWTSCFNWLREWVHKLRYYFSRNIWRFNQDSYIPRARLKNQFSFCFSIHNWCAITN